MEKIKKNRNDDALKRINQLEIEASILRDAYFQLEKTSLERRKAEEKFRTIFENIKDIVLYVDKFGRIVEVNERLEEVLGYKRKEVIGKHFARLGIIRLKSLPRMIKLFKDSIVQGRAISLVEMEIKDKKGNWIPIEANTKVIKEQGEVKGTMNILRDISERKRLEEELIKSEESYRNLVENTVVGIARINLRGKFIFANDKLCEMVGYSKNELIGKSFAKFLHPEEKKKIWKLFLRSFSARNKITNYLEFQAISKKGESIYMSASPSINRYGGRIVSLNAVLQDITERKKMEEVLRGSEERYRNLIESSNDIIQSVKNDGSFQFVNKAWCDVLGYSRKEALRLNLLNIIHPDSLGHCKALFKEVLRGKKVEGIEAKFLTKDKRVILVEGQAGPKYVGGKIVATLGYFKDITERKKAEEERLEALYSFKERVKELTCLYQIDNITRKKDITTEKILQEVAEIIPSAWQYSKVACARIVFETKEYRSKNFKNTKWCQQSDITTNNKKIGSVRMCYLEKKPPEYEGPFLKEERALIDSITQRLGKEIKRKKAERELRESELRFKNIFNSAGNSFILVDDEMKIIDINQATLDTLKYDKKYLTGKNALKLHLKDDYEKCKKNIRLSLLGETVTCDCSYLDVKGDLIYAETLMSPIIIGGRKYVLLSFTDVTERKKAERALSESEQRLKEAQRVAHVGNWDWNIETNELLWSDEIYRIFGLKPQEFGATYESFLKSVHPDDRNFVKKSIDEALSKKKPYSIDHRIVLPSGKERIVHEEAKIFCNKLGEPIRMLGTVHDITERKKTEEEIKSSEERLKILFESAPDAYLLINIKGSFVDVNKRAEELTGYKRKEMIGKNFLTLKLLSGKEITKAVSGLKEVALGKPMGVQEYDLIQKNGKQIAVEIKAHLIKIRGKIFILSIARDITKRKKAEEELKISEEKHRSLFISASEGIVNIDLNGKLLDINPRFLSILGLKREEVVDKNVIHLARLFKVDIKRVASELKRYVLGQALEETEWVITNKRGEEIVILIHPSFIKKDGKMVSILAMIKDITERKKAEQELKESEERFRNIFEGVKDIFVYLDKSGKIKNVNKTAIEILGMAKKELIGKHFTKIGMISLKDIPNIIRDFARTLSGKEGGLEVHITNKKGKEIILESSSTLLKIDNKILGVMIVARDITERKRMEKELAKHSEHLEEQVKERTSELEKAKNKSEALLASIGDGVFAIDTKMNIIHFSPRAEELSGYKTSEVLGKPYYDFLHFIKEKDRTENNTFVKKALGGKLSSMSDETILIKKDKSELPVEDSAAPIRDEKGKIIGAIVVFRDATKERDIQRMKSEYTTLVSHELRTPMTVVNGYLEMLEDETREILPEEQRRLISETKKASNRLLELTKALLNIARLEEGRMETKPIMINLVHLTEGAVTKEIEELFKQKEQEFIFKKPKTLPKIKIDPKFLTVPIQNLLSNASKYTPQKGRIEFEVSKKDNDILFRVSDSGIGIPKKEQVKLFEKFFRASNTTRIEKGTGLGLYMAKLMIESLGGKIWFKSKENKGTTFYLSLPIFKR